MLKAGRSIAYVKDFWASVKQLIRWLYTEGQFARLPRNLSSGDFVFRVPAKTLKTFTVEQVKRLLCRADGWMKTMILTRANIGGTPCDLANLRNSELNMEEGRITRKRSKTAAIASTPTISYRLWPATITALREHAVLNGEYALRNREGGKLQSRPSDPVGRAFRELVRSLKMAGSVKWLRATGATLLDEKFGREVERLYVGRGVAGVDERSYIAVSKQRLDPALEWYGRELGLVDEAKCYR